MKNEIKPAQNIIYLNSVTEKYALGHKIRFFTYYPKWLILKKYTNDGVHSTLAGYKVMEAILKEAILKALK